MTCVHRSHDFERRRRAASGEAVTESGGEAHRPAKLRRRGAPSGEAAAVKLSIYLLSIYYLSIYLLSIYYLSLYLSIYLSIYYLSTIYYLSLYLSIYLLYISLSIYLLSISLSIYLSTIYYLLSTIYLSIYLSIYYLLSISLSLYLSTIYLSIYLSTIYLSLSIYLLSTIYLYIYLSIYLSTIYLSIYISIIRIHPIHPSISSPIRASPQRFLLHFTILLKINRHQLIHHHMTMIDHRKPTHSITHLMKHQPDRHLLTLTLIFKHTLALMTALFLWLPHITRLTTRALKLPSQYISFLHLLHRHHINWRHSQLRRRPCMSMIAAISRRLRRLQRHIKQLDLQLEL